MSKFTFIFYDARYLTKLLDATVGATKSDIVSIFANSAAALSFAYAKYCYASARCSQMLILFDLAFMFFASLSISFFIYLFLSLFLSLSLSLVFFFFLSRSLGIELAAKLHVQVC
jgi:hypothetical protein